MEIDIDTLPKFNLRGDIGPSVSDGILEMFGGAESVSPSDLRQFLDENKEANEIVIEISSDGGYTNAAFEMFDMLKASAKTIWTIGYKVNSAATIIMLAGDEGKRLAAENAQCVVHKAAIPAEQLMGGPRLTQDELKKLAAEGGSEDKRILNHYTKVLGRDKEQSLMADMAAERNIGAKGMVKYGFANEIYKPKKKVTVDPTKKRALAITPGFVNFIENKISNDMSKDTASIEKKFDSFLAKIEKLFKGAKNLKADVSLTTGDGKVINVATEDETIEGKPAMLDGAPAPDGEYQVTKEDGSNWKITVEAGNVKVAEAVEAAAPAEVEALKKENAKAKADLKAATDKVAKLESHLATANKAVTDSTKAVNELKTEFTNFKKEIVGDDKDKGTKHKSFEAMTRDERAKLTPTERLKIIQLDRFKN